MVTVYTRYKRNNSDKWHGPGTVIGKDGKQILVRHGGVYVRVHTCQLQHAPTTDKLESQENKVSKIEPAKVSFQEVQEELESESEEEIGVENDVKSVNEQNIAEIDGNAKNFIFFRQ